MCCSWLTGPGPAFPCWPSRTPRKGLPTQLSQWRQARLSPGEEEGLPLSWPSLPCQQEGWCGPQASCHFIPLDGRPGPRLGQEDASAQLRLVKTTQNSFGFLPAQSQKILLISCLFEVVPSFSFCFFQIRFGFWFRRVKMEAWPLCGHLLHCRNLNRINY